MSNGTTVPGAGALVRQDYTGQSLEVRSDQNVAAVAAQAEAMVKARWALAKMNPRDIDLVRVRILKDAKRPGFADSAIYAKPVGRKKNARGQWEDAFIEGASVRFAEAIMRHMGNMLVEAVVVSDDREKRIVQVSVTDLETVSTDSVQVMIDKTVERRGDDKGNPPKDRTIIGERLNSYGDKVFIVLATEDELVNKTNSAISKARRNKILEMAPADIVEEAMDACRKTTAKADAEDPDAARRKLIDAFAELQVFPTDLRDWLGHEVEKVTAQEIADLKKVWRALRDGEATWSSIMETRKAPATEAKATVPKTSAPAAKPKEEKQEAKTAPTQEEPPPPSDADAPPEVAAAGEPTLEEILLAEIPDCRTTTDCDAVSKRAQAMPKGEARDRVGRALSARRVEIGGAR